MEKPKKTPKEIIESLPSQLCMALLPLMGAGFMYAPIYALTENALSRVVGFCGCYLVCCGGFIANDFISESAGSKYYEVLVAVGFLAFMVAAVFLFVTI